MARGDNPDFRQASFAGGEVSPLMYGRNDYKKFKASLRKCENWIVTQQGSLVNRPGTSFIAEVKDSTQKVRLVPFIFSNSQALVLEFGAGYIRFYQNGAQIKSGGVPVEVATPYAAADLFKLKFAQSGDVVTITHQSYAPQDLSRLNTAGTSWSFAPTTYGVAPPQPFTIYWLNFDVSWSTTGSPRNWAYGLTAIYADGRESRITWLFEVLVDRTQKQPKFGWTINAAADRPVAYNVYIGRGETWGLLDTLKASSLVSGFSYQDSGYAPDFAQGPPEWTQPFAGPPGAYTLNAFNEKGARVYVNGNTYEVLRAGWGCNGSPNVASGTYLDMPAPAAWSPGASVGIATYVVYNGGLWHATNSGTTGANFPSVAAINAVGQTVNDNGVIWAYQGPGWFATWKFIQIGQASAQYPAVCAYFGQRKVFANFSNNPSRIVGSQVGNFKSFDVQPSPLDSDAVDFTLATSRYEEIRSFIELKALLALTSERDWTISGASGGEVTPSSILARPNNVRGAAWLDPISVGVSALYVQALGTQIWELVFDFYTQSYLGNEITVTAQHLLLGHQIVDWTYAPVPYSVVWAAREDGKLLGCTYVREQEMLAWHRHTTQGSFESVCAIPETINGVAETGVYVVVKRTKGGGDDHRYVERFATRTLSIAGYDTNGYPIVDTTKGVFLDASVTSAGMTISGLSHLEGLSVMALADGNVCGPYTVAGGQITLTNLDFTPSTVIVGLPYNSDGETLDLMPDGQELRSNLKNVYRVSFEVADTRGFAVGPSFDKLIDWDQRDVSDGWNPVAPYTGLDHIRIQSRYEHNGRVVFRHSDPLPATLLAIGREVNVGGD